MKTRGSKSKKEYGLACDTVGSLPYWEMKGYVQDVSENTKFKVDYIKFCIKEDPEQEFYEVFSISLPHDLDVLLEVGDAVIMRGTIRTWKTDEGGRKIELVATECKNWHVKE